MGSVIQAGDRIELSGTVEASDAVDRIELVRDGQVAQTCSHRERWTVPEAGELELKLRVEFGWGPPENWGLEVGEHRWRGSLEASRVNIESVEGCFTRGPQQVRWDGECCEWELATSANRGPALGPSQQALVFTLKGDASGAFTLDTGYTRYTAALRDALRRAVVLPDLDTSRALILEQFGLRDFENSEQRAYTSAYKTLVSRAVSREAYSLGFAFTDKVRQGESCYYVRVTQDNGQMAWSSPIWVESS
jgi:hypothetical protein